MSEKRIETERRHGHYHILECAYGRFERALALPVAVDEARTQAGQKRGVLTVTLPKLQHATRNRITIDVES